LGSRSFAKTPFVIGTYKKTARLVKPEYKNAYAGHSFKEEVIIWHGQASKGQRFYFSDDNCIAMFSPTEGMAITHNSNLFPGFGPARERFAFMGVPVVGLAGQFEKCMEIVVEETTSDRDEFAYTPFEITIESNGREGRVYVAKEHAHYFKA